MTPEYRAIRNITAREFTAALRKDGFSLSGYRGSHRYYIHPDGRRVEVAYHLRSDSFPPKTLRIMVARRAKWVAEDLQRLGLVK
jgi:predicted RNA binding protein YcfA (HicA-like mRNA interferase family)